MPHTSTSDVFIPAAFSRYLIAMTAASSRLVQSGAIVRDPELDAMMAGGGLTFTLPKWNDLGNTAANVSAGATGSPVTPNAITSHQQIGVRLSRNQTFGAVDLAGRLAGDDPMRVTAERWAAYWQRELQRTALATIAGVVANNDADDSDDYIHDITDTYQAGVTDFSAEAFIDAIHTMGDAEQALGIVWMHSVVYAKAKKNNLIDLVRDSENPGAEAIPFFLGREVVVDDGLPVSNGDYTTYILGAGALRWGVGTPAVPIERYRLPLDANGGGSDAEITRVEWCLHPDGHAYVGTAPVGGPDNTGNAHMLAAAASWDRRVPERKQVRLAVLRTTEHA